MAVTLKAVGTIGLAPGRITDVPGIIVGHCTRADAGTGCTAILCESPAIAGADVRGAAPGSRETELLNPLAAIQHVNGVMLSGGSAFGLEAATGAVRFLEERGAGLKVGRAVIPIVPSAIIFDLNLVTHKVRPTADDGYQACQAAAADFAQGSVGAGTGATVAKLRGKERAVKGGLGTSSVRMADGVVVGALMVVNAVGGVVDPANGEIVAGPRRPDGSFEDSVRLLIEEPPRLRTWEFNTVIGVVATNATLDRRGATRLAGAGQDAIALAVRPVHMSGDGDTVFALSTCAIGEVHEDRLRAAATEAVVRAILNGVRAATGLGSVPSVSELLAKKERR
ncbi:MAG: P1 family peptidase [Chloroflexi bacterium]|nr:P1 family peptidase [Chloroflexota bacterium]